jgi:hypothetical protein
VQSGRIVSCILLIEKRIWTSNHLLRHLRPERTIVGVVVGRSTEEVKRKEKNQAEQWHLLAVAAEKVELVLLLTIEEVVILLPP